ncbi:MAG TPA: DegT/DnrJ/EryC1/StrS family aminotransferase [Polyangiaceae bacterium]
MIPLADLQKQYEALRGELEPVLAAVCTEQSFVLGPRVATFERALAEFVGVPHAVGVKSGSDALLLALLALGVGPGDEVVTTPFTFFATAGAVCRTGATPVFADVRADTLALDPGAAARAVTPRTKAILVVHLFGQPAELAELAELAEARGIALVEDAAQALGAKYGSKAAGAVGRVGCFSFHPSKPLGAFGDAGAVVTSDRALADRLVRLRTHGGVRKNEHELPFGGNHRLDALQAAVLSVKLPHLPGWLAARRAHARAYDEALSGISGLGLPPRVAGTESSVSAYTVRVRDRRRDALAQHLREAGIDSAVYYPKPLHLQPALAALAPRRSALPVAENAAREVLSLPVHPELSVTERERVTASLHAFFEASARVPRSAAGGVR